jgi:hypothetical protein
MSASKKTAFQALIEAVTAADEKAIEDAATRAVRERLKAKPRRQIKCRTS